MNFKKINNISGWVVCAIACTVFILTREATASFWDCGEFIPCAYRLEISHPPGAPLFILLGRFFIILFGGSLNGAVGDPHAAVQVNLLSAMSSGFAVLFLFWTITRLAKKLLVTNGDPINLEKTIAIIGAGAVGALAFTFSDSFWFSAVEGIVFGVSPAFHLRGLLGDREMGGTGRSAPGGPLDHLYRPTSLGFRSACIFSACSPSRAVVMTYYFRRFNYTRWGMIIAFLVACLLTGVVQILVIQYSVKLMGMFEIVFVNSLNLPFNSGSYFFIALPGRAHRVRVALGRPKGQAFA